MPVPDAPRITEKPPTSGTFKKLHIVGGDDWGLEGNWKCIGGSPTSYQPAGFLNLDNSDFVPLTAVTYAQRVAVRPLPEPSDVS